MFKIGIMAGLVIAYAYNELEQLYKRNKSAKSVIKVLEDRVSIKDLLDGLLADIGANRVSIIKYIDSGATMIYESVKEGTPEIQSSFKNIDSTACLPMLLELEKKGFVEVNKNSGDAIVRLHNAINVKTSFKYKIGDSITDGCLVVAFSRDHELTPGELKSIVNTIIKIKPLLCSNK